MPEITLTEEQYRILTESHGTVDIRTPTGEAVAILNADDAAMVLKIRERHAAGNIGSLIPASVVRKVMERMTAEQERTGGLEKTEAQALWKKFREEELGNG